MLHRVVPHWGALCPIMGCPPPRGGETEAGGWGGGGTFSLRAAGLLAAAMGVRGGADRVLPVPTVPVGSSEARGAEQTVTAGADRG